MELMEIMRRICRIQLTGIVAGLLLMLTLQARGTDSPYLNKPWEARWIAVPGENPTGYGVYYFRKSFDLEAVPKTFPVFLSADNRYKLFVNEILVSLGPARGDLTHWNYETVDLAPFLRPGRNSLAAQVWNEAELRTEGHLSLRTAFILQGAAAETQVVNTNASWKCVRDSGYSPIPIRLQTYYVAGPGERIDMAARQNDWKKNSFTENNWKPAQPLFPGFPKNVSGQFGVMSNWLLVPSSLPQMELTEQRLLRLRKAEGITVPASFPATKTAITVPANTVVTLVLDQAYLTNAYPELIFSGGKGGVISLSYQEALFTKYPAKGNRDEIEGKTLSGRVDSIFLDGTAHQHFTSLNWRTFRYLQLRIRTNEFPLELEDIYSTFTGYPFHLIAKLETDNEEMQKMLGIGWRTARLCAMETYMDCPYYEQLQYIGDTRIQGLVSLYNSGDDRLLRKALNLMDDSRLAEGLTASRHPSVTPQYIPTFSLWYIGMLHDYMMYGKDPAFVRHKLPGARQILNYFNQFQQADGSLKNVPYWIFTDWVMAKGWAEGVGPVGKDGYSSLLDLQLLAAYQLAADMEEQLGMQEYVRIYHKAAATLKNTIQKKYWDPAKGLYADRTEKDLFSQHANALAILTGMVSGKAATVMAKQMLADTTLAPASIYFKYYLHQALTKAGLGNQYLDWLDKWRENMAMGLTTWAETSDLGSTRSDCHAWGASPNIEFFRTILGIDTDAPGFTKVKIEPHPGGITKIGGEIPHPGGTIQVQYSQTNGYMHANIYLPRGTPGRFIWKGRSYPLSAGKNRIKIPV